MNKKLLVEITDSGVKINFSEVPDMSGNERWETGYKKQKQIEECIKEIQFVLCDLYNRAVIK